MRTARAVPTPWLCRNTIISRTIFCSAQASVIRLARTAPMPVTSRRRSGSASLYAGVKRTWPVPELKKVVAKLTNQATGKDQFGRLLSYPGKTEIACPLQDRTTAVLLLVGQSNAGNYQGQRHQSEDDRVVNFSAGHCYRAVSP